MYEHHGEHQLVPNLRWMQWKLGQWGKEGPKISVRKLDDLDDVCLKWRPRSITNKITMSIITM